MTEENKGTRLSSTRYVSLFLFKVEKNFKRHFVDALW